MKNNLEFRKIDGTIIHNVLQYVKDFITKYPYCEVSIGCDSHMHSRYIKYVIVICLHDVDDCGVGHGAHVISADYVDYSKNLKTDLYAKLWQEAELSIEVADRIKDCGKKLSIHLDYNSDENALSNVLYDSGLGYVKSMGYEGVGKPLSYSATYCADHLAR